MCTNYIPSSRDRFKAMRLGVDHLPESEWPAEVFPGYQAPIVTWNARDQRPQLVLARFGLIPRWCRDAQQAQTLSRGTYNARSETVHSKPSYRQAWRERQLAVAPMESFFEPSWDSGKAVRWRVARQDGQPFGAAALWEQWTDPESADIITSFSLLTVNADGHPIMGRLHRPDEEKRMPVLLTASDIPHWLATSANDGPGPLQAAAAELLRSEAAPLVRARPRRAMAVEPGPSPNLSLF